MIFTPMVQFTIGELRTLREGFSALGRIADELDDLGGGEVVRRAVNRLAESRNPVAAEHLEEGMAILRVLVIRLGIEAHAVADPAWVAATKVAREAGRVPLVPDPEGAVAMLCEVRQRQLERATLAMHVLDSGRGYLRRLERAASPAPGDHYEPR